MGRHGQRHNNKKRQHYEERRNESRSFGVSDALNSAKRRRLSVEHDRDNTSPHRTEHYQTNGQTEDDEWQTVPHRRANHSFPELSFKQRVTKPVPVEQLRDLVLYVLADGVGPEWVAVKNTKAITKTVVLMVPGLDQYALKRSRELIEILREAQKRKQLRDDHGNGNTEELLNYDDPPDTFENGQMQPNNTSDTVMQDYGLLWDGMDDFFDILKTHRVNWLLDETFPAKAPGDAKHAKVHSPLQAMLIAPVSDKVEKSDYRHALERQYKPVTTPITHFIHTADELREAEYPIHPATFDSAADAELEATRRESTGQSRAAGWVDSQVTDSRPVRPSLPTNKAQDTISQDLHILSVDCEMVLTTDQKSSLARVSVVSWPDGKIILDKYVKPDLPVENYFTQYSGITPKILEDVTTTLVDIQEEMKNLLTSSTVLLGHSLESDLNALKMTHPFIIDTSMLFPHPRGLPLRSSLKFLANKYLKREIQTGGANGHDSVEDARAVLDLVKLKCEKGPKYGTTEAIGESIFKRLSRHNRKDSLPLTTATVEYGSTPERGLGKDATYAIGCQNDDEITTGMIRAINGDVDGKEIPAGGVNFVWGRLRAVEFARGWVSNNSTSTNTNNPTTTPNPSTAAPETTSITDPPTQESIDKSILQTLRNIAKIRNSLPRTTLLMIYSGISDMRPVLRLQGIQAQYRKEFKVKKWDELSVKWTDVEEQDLRNAVEKARVGWAWAKVV